MRLSVAAGAVCLLPEAYGMAKAAVSAPDGDWRKAIGEYLRQEIKNSIEYKLMGSPPLARETY